MIIHERGCDSLGQLSLFPLLASLRVKSLIHYLLFSKVWPNRKNSHLSLVKMILLHCFQYSTHFQTGQPDIFYKSHLTHIYQECTENLTVIWPILSRFLKFILQIPSSVLCNSLLSLFKRRNNHSDQGLHLDAEVYKIPMDEKYCMALQCEGATKERMSYLPLVPQLSRKVYYHKLLISYILMLEFHLM